MKFNDIYQEIVKGDKKKWNRTYLSNLLTHVGSWSGPLKKFGGSIVLDF